jgi:hypothetical protein
MGLRSGALVKLAGVGLLLAGGAFLMYSWINATISLDYARQQQKLDQTKIELLRDLLRYTSTSLTRGSLEQIIEQHYSRGHVVKQQQDRIQVDDVIFRLDGESIVQVLLLGEDAHNPQDHRP